MPISCAYCGGTHASAADVRACWDRQPGADEAAGARTGEQVLASPGEPGPVIDASAGPACLGRNLVLVGEAGPIPLPWQGCEVLDVGAWADSGAVTDRLVDRLVAAAGLRERLVLRSPYPFAPPGETEAREPWEVGPRYRFGAEWAYHLATSNSVVIEAGSRARFALSEAAVALGAVAAVGGESDGRGDVILPGGERAWCDGGPIRPWSTADGLGEGVAVVHRVAIEHGSLRPLGAGPALLAELADDQRRAVEAASGAVRVIAPAGSGKTRVLTERARHLLTGWGVPAGAVCLVAYNVRAAEEMRARTSDVPRLEVRTLNSLALALVNGTPPFLGTGPRRATIDEHRVRDILARIVDLPRRSNTDPAAAWIEALSAVRLGLREPAGVEDEYAGDTDGLPVAFAAYRAALAAEGVVDFDEQVYLAVEILLRDPRARAAAQRACRMLLVDEVQDLTPAHVLLLRLVAGPDAAVFGVGDDDQTIYGYAGASPDWLIGFAGLFPGAAEHALEVNYRCPPAVVAAAGRLLARNRRRVPKRISPAPGRRSGPGDLELLDASEDPGGVAATVERVKALVEGGTGPDQVAVLARVSAALVPVQVALRELGIPTHTVLDDAWLRRTGVAAALAWLRLAARPQRLAAADLRVALRRPPRGIAPKVVDWVADQRSLGQLEALAGRLTGRDGPKVAGLATDLGRLAALVGAGTGAPGVLAVVRDELGLDGAMVSLEGARRRLDRSAQTDDLDALVGLARLHPDVATFEEWLRARLAEPSVREGVTVATVHSVKGREWPHVVVHQARAGVMPHRLASDVEEERRVFHVAITRGIESVAVSCGEPPSPFVAELVREPSADPVAPVGEGAERRPAAAAARTAPRAGATPDARIQEALRAWRRGIAAEEKRPAYTVMHDTTLDAIAAARPATLAELRRVKGIGPAKAERYGDVLLALVAEAAG